MPGLPDLNAFKLIGYYILNYLILKSLHCLGIPTHHLTLTGRILLC